MRCRGPGRRDDEAGLKELENINCTVLAQTLTVPAIPET